MSDLQHPDDVIRALRGPATSGELAGEHETVDRMVTIRHRHEESTVKTFARPSRIAALVAAGVIGFGGVAAAGPGGFDPLGLEAEDPTIGEEVVEDEEAVVEEDEEEGVVAEEEIVEEDVEKEDVAEDESVEPQAAEAMEEEPTEPPLFADNDLTYFNEELCLPGPHGRTVSAFARGELEFEGYDYDVSDVAKSDCGKPWLRPWEPEDETEASGDESVTKTEVEEVEVEEVDRDRGRPAHAGGGAEKGAKDKADKGNRGGGKGRGGR